MLVDLARNTVDGRKVMPRVCELAWVMANAEGPLKTLDVIAKLYGPHEPQDAQCALRQTARLARLAGIPISATLGPGGCYRLG
jgi:hypothetical protein